MPEPITTPIVRRRVNIIFNPANAKGWYWTRKDIEDFLNALSFVFPSGEKFFIQSVQHYQNRITDPALKDQVKRFIYQEAMHTKEHSRCNEALYDAHPYGHDIEKFTARMMALNRLIFPKSWQLASTCALEHFTAIVADALLRIQETFIAESDPAFASLWLWHAVEEAEHKGVCFDVYQTMFGEGVVSYLRRVNVMFWITVGFLVLTFISSRLVKKGEKARHHTTGEPAGAPSSKSGTRHLLKEIVSLKLYFDYYRPSFHPWDHDNRDHIEEWKRRYRNFGAGPDAPLEATA